MQPDAYREMAAVEDRHWWFVGRRTILSAVLERMRLAPDAKILEIGAGTGGNLRLLSKFGKVSGVEMCREARELAQQKAPATDVRLGRFPDDNPFAGRRFDLICLFDVLEHIEQEAETLAAIRDSLTPGGCVLLTVPAYPWLWSGHDAFLQHKRRYTRRGLVRAVTATGFQVEKLTSMNTFLFPLLVVNRCWSRMRGNCASAGNKIPPKPINLLFQYIFCLERTAVAGPGLPFGSSLLAVLRPETPNG